MPDNLNIFERRRDLLVQKLTQRKEAVDKAFGVGQRPYGTVKVPKAEQIAYFRSQSPEKQAELWGQMDETERAEVQQGMNQGG